LGIFSFFKDRFQNNRVTDEKMWNSALWQLAGHDSSGENVNEYTALNYSAVFNAISLISGTIAALPLNLMRRSGDTTAPETNHTLYPVLHSKANAYMTSMAVRECMISHVLTWGNGYLEVVRDRMGQISELWPITPNRVTPKMKDDRLVYEIRIDGQILILERENILHIPGLGFDGFMGYSIVGMAAKSIGLGMAMETFGSNYFGQGTHPGVIASHPGKLSDVAHKNLRDSLVSTYSGLGKSHRLMLLEEGMKLEKVGVPPNDSQFLESRQFQIPEIARWFNLPPHKLKDLTKSSFSNIESEQISYVTDSLLPWAVRIEQNLNMQLLTKQEIKSGLYFNHIFEGLLRGSSTDRAGFYSTMFNIGAMSINEIRAKENLNPVEGGDIHLVPLNMTSLENAGKPPEQVPEPLPEPERNDKSHIKILPTKIQGEAK
jgi:HK97 family phage portal protein